MTATSCPTSPWVSTPDAALVICKVLPAQYDAGAPVLSCVSKGVPGIFMDCHMMVSEPEKACTYPVLSPLRFVSDLSPFVQWVNDIADAGGSLYCFHLEATG